MGRRRKTLESTVGLLSDNAEELTRVVLDGKSVSKAHAAKLGAALADNVHATSLSLVGCGLSDAAACALIEPLHKNKNITELVLDENELTNETGEALLALAKRTTTLKRVALADNDVDLELIERIDAALAEDKSHAPPDGDGAGGGDTAALDEVLETLESGVEMDTVRLDGVALSADDAVELTDALVNNDSLAVLSLRGCGLTDKSVVELCDVIAEHDALHTIDLRDNRIGARGGEALLEALEQNAGVHTCHLSGNALSSALEEDIAELMEERDSGSDNDDDDDDDEEEEETVEEEDEHVEDAEDSGSEDEPVKRTNFAADVGKKARADRAHLEETLKSLRDGDADLEAVNMTNVPLSLEDVGELADALAATACPVAKVHVAHCRLSSEGIKVLCDALKGSETLSLVFAGMNRFDDSGAKALLSLVKKCPNVLKCDLSGNEVSHKFIDKIDALLRERKDALNRVEDTTVGDFTERIAANDRHVQVLELTGKPVSVEEARELGDALVNNTRVSVIKMGGCRLSLEALEEIVGALEENKTVESVYLGNNGIEDEGAKVLADMLREHKSITVVSLSNNKIQDGGADALVAACKANRTILKCALDANPVKQTTLAELEDYLRKRRNPRKEKEKAAAAAAAAAAKEKEEREAKEAEPDVYDLLPRIEANEKKLSVVDLTCQRLKTAQLRELGAALMGNTRVQTLRLGSCKINDAGLSALLAGLRSNRAVREVYLGNNKIGDEGGQELLELLRECENIHRASVNGNPMRRVLADEIEWVVAERKFQKETAVYARRQSVGDLADALRPGSPATGGRSSPAKGDHGSGGGGGGGGGSGGSGRKSALGPRRDETMVGLLKQTLRALMNNERSLRTVRLTGVLLTDSDMAAIASGVARNTHVTQLHLSGCGVTNGGAFALFSVLNTQPHVNEINLEGNKITDEGGQAILGALHANEALKKLLIKGNPMNEGVRDEINSIMAARAKAEVWEKRGEVMAFPELLYALAHGDRKLTSVYLSGVAVPEKTAAALATVLMGNEHIKALHMDDCGLTDKAVYHLARYLTCNRSVTEVNLRNNRFSDGGGRALMEALKANDVITKLRISGNAMSRPLLVTLEGLVNVRLWANGSNIDPLLMASEADKRLGGKGDRTRRTVDELGEEVDEIIDQLRDEKKKLERKVKSLQRQLDEANKTASLAAALSANFGGAGSDTGSAGSGGIHHGHSASMSLVGLGGLSLGGGSGDDGSLSARERAAMRTASALTTPRRGPMRGSSSGGGGTFGTSSRTGSGSVAKDDKDAPVTLEVALDLVANNQKKSVVLRGSGKAVGNRGAKKVCKLLAENTVVTSLNLANCSISDSGAKAVAEVIRKHPALTHVYLAGNSIKETGARELLDAVSTNARVKKLALAANPIPHGLASEIDDLVSSRTFLRKQKADKERAKDEEKEKRKRDGAEKVKKAVQQLRVDDEKLLGLNLSGISISNKQANALADALAENSVLKELNLSACRLSDDGAVAIADALLDHPTIMSVHFGSNKLTDKGGQAILEAVSENGSIKKVYTQGNFMSVSLASKIEDIMHRRGKKEGEVVVEKKMDVSALIRQLASNHKKYKTATFSRNKIGKADADALADALCDNTVVRVLEMTNCRITDDVLKVLCDGIASCTSLREVWLGNNKFGDAGAAELVTALQENPSIVKCSVVMNPINQALVGQIEELQRARDPKTIKKAEEERVEAKQREGPALEDLFARVRANEKALTELDLSGRSLAKGRCKELGAALAGNTHVKVLKLAKCKINDAGIESLCDGIAEHPLLSRLELANNRIGDDGATALLDAFEESTSLRSIFLGGNPVSANLQGEFDALMAKRKHQTGSSVVREEPDENGMLRDGDTYESVLAAMNKDQLTHVRLGGAEVSDGRCVAVARALGVASKVQCLYLPENDIGNEGAATLAQALRDHKRLAVLDVAANHIGDKGARVLLAAFKEMTRVKRIDLDDNDVSEDLLDAFDDLEDHR